MIKENKAIVAFIVGACLLVAIALSGCKTIQPTVITRDSVRVETRYDSVYIFKHDSIFRDRWRSGDTVYVTVEKWLTKYRDKVQVVHDTIQAVQERQVVVTKKVTPKWAWYCLIACIGLVAGIIIYIIIKIKTL